MKKILIVGGTGMLGKELVFQLLQRGHHVRVMTRNLEKATFLIDAGAEEVTLEEDGIYIYTSFTDFGGMQKALEERKVNIISAELDRIPSSYTEVNEAQRKDIMDLIDKIEEDDDVQNVFHNMKEEEV